MMIRTTPQPPLPIELLATVAVSLIGLGALAFCVHSYASGSRPVSEFLGRAQSEADARRFEELLGSLDSRPTTAPHDANALPRKHATPAIAKPIAMPIDSKLKPTAQSITTKPPPVSFADATSPRSPTRAEHAPIHKARPDLPNVANDWMRKGSNMLRLVGARF
jgi:hypothetical protein